MAKICSFSQSLTKIVPDAYQLSPGHSYYENEKYDMLSATVARSVERRQAMFGGENYADLLKSPGNLPYKTSDWSDIPTFNKKVTLHLSFW